MSNSRCEYLLERIGRLFQQHDNLHSVLRDCQRRREASVNAYWKASDQGERERDRAQAEIDHWTDRAVSVQNQAEAVSIEIMDLKQEVIEEQKKM
jgi:predicted  nucleic acid-binding Zn-ribbon protein